MIKRRKRLTEPEAAYFMKQLVEATRYMHNDNVIHRDLKLGNLFIDKDMCMKVGDLGLATKVEDKDEKRKTICGTPNYIAPEIIQGDKSKRGHSFEVDVWSMGVILYTVLIGKPPYEAKDVKATYQRILNNEYSFPRHVEISPAAKSLIKLMLQSQPSDRYVWIKRCHLNRRYVVSIEFSLHIYHSCRPTLDEVDDHPFMAESHLPTFLPTSVLSIAPVWRVNKFGELVCTDKVPEYMTGKKPAIPRSNSSSARRPFSSHDPNTNKASSTTTTVPRKCDINMERVVKTAVAAMSGGTSNSDRIGKQRGQLQNLFSSSSTTPAFEIFDESQSQRKPPPLIGDDELSSRDELDTAVQSRVIGKRQTPVQPTLTEEMLCQQTRTLSVQSPMPCYNSAGAASSVFTQTTESAFSSTDNDAEIFKIMIDHVDNVLNIVESRKEIYRSTQLCPLSPRFGPSKWVLRYVDYTCKYGLGFLLNDGSSGVYFNDSTKTALDSNSDTFQYIERKRSDEVHSAKLRGETIVKTHTLSKYPDSLKKKVTLLKHFRNYLMQQQNYDGVEDYPAEVSIDVVDGQLLADLVYVKKWVRTKHAILFSLSNRTIQVTYYDQTELLFTPDIAYLTYVDKQRKRITYNFTDDLVGASAEIEKRLRYAKDIMLQLLGTGHKN